MLSSASTQQQHILIVEDEAHLAFGIKYNLEADNYRVTLATDGPDALKIVQEANPPIDLVILDLMLPGMSGYAVCEKLRAAGDEVPVLMLSARILSEDKARGFDVGADQYQTKPFDLEELLARVRGLLARSQRLGRAKVNPPVAENNATFRFGNVEVNFDTFEVKVRGKPLRPTSMELKLLRYFVENQGRVISRDEILENVWGYDSNPQTRTIDNFVLKLRRYFEEDPTQPRHFLSIRGAGYRFVADVPATSQQSPPASEAQEES